LTVTCPAVIKLEGPSVKVGVKPLDYTFFRLAVVTLIPPAAAVVLETPRPPALMPTYVSTFGNAADE